MRSASLKITSFLFLFFFTINLFSQSFKTSQGIIVPKSIDSLVNLTAVKSARRVAEIAISAILSDSKKIAQKRDALQPDIDNYKKDWNNYTTDKQLHKISSDTYQKNVKIYNTDKVKFDVEYSNYKASIIAYESSPKENRSQAIRNQIKAEETRLEPRFVKLKKQKAELDLSLKRLLEYKTDLNNKYKSLSSRYEQLKYELNAIDIELKNAHKQLQMLFSYSLECNKILQQWKEPVLNTYVLFTQLEQLKALSNKGWN